MIQQYGDPSDVTQTPIARITKISDTFGPVGVGVPVRYKRIEFVTADDQTSYVDVEMTADWIERARQAVIAHAQELMTVRALSLPTIESMTQ